MSDGVTKMAQLLGKVDSANRLVIVVGATVADSGSSASAPGPIGALPGSVDSANRLCVRSA
jgi:hypothetical protein